MELWKPWIHQSHYSRVTGFSLWANSHNSPFSHLDISFTFFATSAPFGFGEETLMATPHRSGHKELNPMRGEDRKENLFIWIQSFPCPTFRLKYILPRKKCEEKVKERNYKWTTRDHHASLGLKCRERNLWDLETNVSRRMPKVRFHVRQRGGFRLGHFT